MMMLQMLFLFLFVSVFSFVTAQDAPAIESRNDGSIVLSVSKGSQVLISVGGAEPVEVALKSQGRISFLPLSPFTTYEFEHIIALSSDNTPANEERVLHIST